MQVANDIYFALAEEQFAAGQRVRLTLMGTSMVPTLRPGDTLTLAPVAAAPVVGDVVLFRYAGSHLLHRVVAVDGDSYTMQGDNCYTTESCRRGDIVGLLVEAGGLPTDGELWRRRSRRSLVRKRVKNFAIRWLGRPGRRQLRPWYFAALAFLMWAPLNGLGLPLDNYVFGLRADHLIHAALYLPCALLLVDLFRDSGSLRRACLAALLAAIAVGLPTEGVQWLLPWRGFDINDLVANAMGTTLGWVAVAMAVRRR